MHVTTVIIGAGHAGLAMSRRLTARSIDHVVLERGQVANSWRTERWDSLRLLTPNWHSRLPGAPYAGDDPDGFMTMPALASMISDYAEAVAAPVQTETTVTRVAPADGGYAVTTDRGPWTCESVVLASGAANVAAVPAMAQGASSSVAMVTPLTYRSPDQLDDRGVLVVGASASGVQLADEIQRSGRPVTLAAGEQVRVPRSYGGRDIFWWLEAAGLLDEGRDEVDDLVRARHIPSPQLIGTPERRSIDLSSLADLGVEVVGRLGSLRDGVAQFSGGLANTCRLADLKMQRLLDRFDDWARHNDLDLDDPPRRPEPIRRSGPAVLDLDLHRRGIRTIVWATGYRPDHSWLDVPVLDRRGRVRHDGGVVLDSPGLYLLGGNLLRSRRSSYLAGADADTLALANHLRDHLDRVRLDRSRRRHPLEVLALDRGRASTAAP